MSDDHAIDVDKHVRTYILIFVALAILTCVTVGVSYLEDLSVGAGIVLALLIATVKAGLVACYFMHLITEKKLILWVLLLTFSFFLVLLLIPVLTSSIDSLGS